jgi:hypothetical protein
MDRRDFIRLLWGAPAVAFFEQELKSEPSASEQGPTHECVDRPNLPCPACAKWTGDPLAIKSTRSPKTRRKL